MNKKIFITVVLVVFLTGSSTLFFFSKTQKQNESEEDFFKRVKVVEVEKGNIVQKQEYSGVVKGYQETDLAPKISGFLEKIYKKEGDEVAKGEILAEINGDQISAQRKLSQTQVNNAQDYSKNSNDYYNQLIDEAKANREAYEDLYSSAKDSGSDQEKEIAKNNFEIAKEAEASAKRMRDLQSQMSEGQVMVAKDRLGLSVVTLDDTKITAPFKGVLIRKNYDEGVLVSPQTAIFSIARNDKKEVDIFLAGNVADELNLSEEVSLTDSLGNKFIGKIEAIAPSADSVSRKSLVRIVLENPEVRLGEFLKAEIETKNKTQVVTIPIRAIQKNYHDNFVFVVSDNKTVRKQKVELGIVEDDQVEVVSGVLEKDLIVIEGQTYLKDNERIKIYE